MNKKQIRYVELRNAQSSIIEDQKIIEGYAAIFESPTVLFIDEYNNEFKEVILRNAFDKTDFSDCCFKYNHSSAVPIMARTRGNSLQVMADDKGLFFRAKLPDTTTANDIYTLIKSGILDKCSFAFFVEDEEYDRQTRTRIIKSIKSCVDVSIVDIPAYSDTSCEARNIEEGKNLFTVEIEKERLDKREKLQQYLLLKTYL
jgi:HK97 family phage prohead protease